MTVQYKTEKQSLKRVYYEGSDTIYNGYCLCYNYDTTTDTGGSAGSADVGRAYRVEKPATANLRYFAGVVVQLGSAGVTGPAWVTIQQPEKSGPVAEVYVSSFTGTIASTIVGVQDASYAATTSTSAIPAIGIVAQSATSKTGVILVRLTGTSATDMDIAAAVTAPTKAAAGSTTGGTYKLQNAIAKAIGLPAATGVTTGATYKLFNGAAKIITDATGATTEGTYTLVGDGVTDNTGGTAQSALSGVTALLSGSTTTAIGMTANKTVINRNFGTVNTQLGYLANDLARVAKNVNELVNDIKRLGNVVNELKNDDERIRVKQAAIITALQGANLMA